MKAQQDRSHAPSTCSGERPACTVPSGALKPLPPTRRPMWARRAGLAAALPTCRCAFRYFVRFTIASHSARHATDQSCARVNQVQSLTAVQLPVQHPTAVQPPTAALGCTAGWLARRAIAGCRRRRLQAQRCGGLAPRAPAELPQNGHHSGGPQPSAARLLLRGRHGGHGGHPTRGHAHAGGHGGQRTRAGGLGEQLAHLLKHAQHLQGQGMGTSSGDCVGGNSMAGLVAAVRASGRCA